MKNTTVGTALTTAILGLALTQTSLAAGAIDFETAGDLANNFRICTNVVNSAYLSQSGLSDGNDFIIHNNNPANSSSVSAGFYDTTPGDGALTQNLLSGSFSVSFDISAVQPGSSFGVFFLNPDESGFRADNLCALFNLDVTNSPIDRIRFFKDGNSPWNNAAVGTVVGSTVDGSSGLDMSTDSAPVWGHLNVDYTVTAGIPALTLSVGSFSATSAYALADALPANVEVGFRIYDSVSPVAGDGTAKIDNFQITLAPVPEPTSAALIGLGLGAVLMKYRRRRAA